MPNPRCDVIHVVNQMRPGGIETMVFDIVSQSAYKSCIFSLEGEADELIENWPGLKKFRNALDGFGKQPGLTPALVARLAQRMRSLQPKAVFLHRLNPLLYGGLAARIARVPAIVHVEHDVWQYSDPGRLRLLTVSRRLVRPEVHFAVSSAIAEELERLLPSASVKVVPGGVDLNRYCQRERAPALAALGLPDDAKVIGSAGRLEEVKGHSVLVSALADLPSETHVVLVGDGTQRNNLTELARAVGVENRLHFLGHRDDLEKILPAFNVFCLPSLSEGLPRVVMEAQAADIPVVASDVGSVRQAVDPATGSVVPSGNPKELARALALALASPPSAGAVRAFAVGRFGIDRLVAAYDSIATPHIDATGRSAKVA